MIGSGTRLEVRACFLCADLHISGEVELLKSPAIAACRHLFMLNPEA